MNTIIKILSELLETKLTENMFIQPENYGISYKLNS